MFNFTKSKQVQVDDLKRNIPPGKVDFASVGLGEYTGCFAIVLDNLFSKQELSRFLRTAEQSSEWDIAKVNAGPDLAFVDTSYRNGQRIILDDFDLSREIFERIRPHLAEVEFVEENVYVRRESTAPGARGRHVLVKEVRKKKMVRMNERLRFLRYPEGGFFARHTDGCYITPDGKQRTYMTVQLYLPSSSDESDESFKVPLGGSTRFHSGGNKRGAFCDVEPIPGRVLVFQHDKLIHTGEEVLGGIKCTMRSDILYENVEEEDE
ncbi:hypothetical protein T439DRAFT_380542 [Meredithblackwellia eburnea MCA 4105]